MKSYELVRPLRIAPADGCKNFGLQQMRLLEMVLDYSEHLVFYTTFRAAQFLRNTLHRLQIRQGPAFLRLQDHTKKPHIHDRVQEIVRQEEPRILSQKQHPAQQNQNKRQPQDLAGEVQRKILRIGIVVIHVQVNVPPQSEQREHGQYR